MADIVRAIKREQEYLAHRMKGKEPFHLVDAVRECGFETLDAYFKAKHEHQFKSLEFDVLETTPLQAIDTVMKVIAAKKPAVIFVDIDSVVVWPTNNEEYDKDYCVAEGLPLLFTGTNVGSTLVSTPGDLGVGICIPVNLGADISWVANGFVEIFKKYTEKSVYNEGNDVMVDGFKVCGITCYETSDVFMAITPVSITEKLELVSKICLKPRKKIPGFIDFMTRDELWKEVSEWLLAHSI